LLRTCYVLARLGYAALERSLNVTSPHLEPREAKIVAAALDVRIRRVESLLECHAQPSTGQHMDVAVPRPAPVDYIYKLPTRPAVPACM
jgi:hypothetical protein